MNAIGLVGCFFSMAVPLLADPPKGVPYAEIRVVDAATGQGVPLVELETVNSLIYVTDNLGRVAFQEPGLMDREIHFTVRSHGYEHKKDGFGIVGVKVVPKAGSVAEIVVNRKSVAERLGRLTGEGRYRDTQLLGHAVPVAESKNPGRVAGQDSVQSVQFKDKILWLWGDTLRMEYPLGLFRMAGATTPILNMKISSSNIMSTLAFDYFVDPNSQFVRAMIPLQERPDGVIWIFALAVVPDEHAQQKLIGHYSRRKGLTDELEHGIALLNEEKQIFEVAKTFPLSESWRRPTGHPIRWREGDRDWLLFGSPTPNVRVPATLNGVLDWRNYEAYTCLNQAREVERLPNGALNWRWQKELPPISSVGERDLVKAKKIRPEESRFYPANVANSLTRVVLHSGSVRWNVYRKRWVLVACEIGGDASFLGEVWYAEADHPTGPFTRAVKILTHDRQTFYNVCHHDFMDRDDGRFIHFEGTYTNEFSSNPHKTPRYNYNQILYRLDLNNSALKPVQGDSSRK